MDDADRPFIAFSSGALSAGFVEEDETAFFFDFELKILLVVGLAIVHDRDVDAALCKGERSIVPVIALTFFREVFFTSGDMQSSVDNVVRTFIGKEDVGFKGEKEVSPIVHGKSRGCHD